MMMTGPHGLCTLDPLGRPWHIYLRHRVLGPYIEIPPPHLPHTHNTQSSLYIIIPETHAVICRKCVKQLYNALLTCYKVIFSSDAIYYIRTSLTLFAPNPFVYKDSAHKKKPPWLRGCLGAIAISFIIQVSVGIIGLIYSSKLITR